jgi:HAD superfamily hydrolase (TIGR01490 family)
MDRSEKLDNLPDAAIAFFDLDETITDADTDSLWSAWRSRRELRGWAERVWLGKLYRDFRKGRMVIEEYMKYQRFRIGQLAADEYRELGKAFFNDSGRHHMYPEAEVLIGDFKKAGCRVVLLTAQNDCIAGPFAEHLRMDDMIANRFGTDGIRFTEPVKPYCFNEGKVELGRKYADDAGVPLARCAFFGDSFYDAPFLNRVGFPYATNPDSMLEALARRKNWRIVRFGVQSTR